MVRRNVHLLLLIIIFSVTLHAQKEVTVTKEYVYRAPGTMSAEEARQMAVEKAKLEAIEEHFGSSISQNNTTYITNQGGESNIQFNSLMNSEIKGEWIETIGEPEYGEIVYQHGFLIIPCKIKGKIREATASELDFTAKVLCNGVTPQHERDIFMAGDDLYLFFQSPYSGYLMVFLTDYKSETTYCILPYFLSPDPHVNIERNKKYIFLSKQEALKEEKSIVDEYVMTCEHSSEMNEITFVFSNKPFSLPTFEIGEEGFKYLSYKDFTSWLEKTRKKRKDFTKKRYPITINKKPIG